MHIILTRWSYYKYHCGCITICKGSGFENWDTFDDSWFFIINITYSKIADFSHALTIFPYSLNKSS